MNSKNVIEKTSQAMKESNKVLIQELIKDLEEKGIKPVIAIDGEVKKLSLIDESELEDFYTQLKTNHENKENFCVVEAEKSISSNQTNFYTPSGIVIVICKNSGKIKEYKAGNASSWPAEFAHDLQNKFFK